MMKNELPAGTEATELRAAVKAWTAGILGRTSNRPIGDQKRDLGRERLGELDREHRGVLERVAHRRGAEDVRVECLDQVARRVRLEEDSGVDPLVAGMALRPKETGKIHFRDLPATYADEEQQRNLEPATWPSRRSRSAVA